MADIGSSQLIVDFLGILVTLFSEVTEPMSNGQLEMLKAGLSLLIALITLGLGWWIGGRLAVKWNLIQKERETDIAILQQFYSLYGEFKEVSKTWRMIKRNNDARLVVPPESRWSLLARACAVESKNEAVMVKLATERNLDTHDLERLGLFRQAVQQLRESIRDDKEILFASRGPEYVFFNNLAAEVSLIISSSDRDAKSDSKSASDRSRTIANIRSPDFKRALERFRETNPELPQEKT